MTILFYFALYLTLSNIELIYLINRVSCKDFDRQQTNNKKKNYIPLFNDQLSL